MKKARRMGKRADVSAALAVRAFGQGFLAGADPRRAMRRHAVDALSHVHWRRGFDAGRDAVFAAESGYGLELAGSEERERSPSRRSRKPSSRKS